MSDTSLLIAALEAAAVQSSRLSTADDEPRPKPRIGRTELRKNFAHPPAFRRNLSSRRYEPSNKRTSSGCDRGGWWRMTIKDTPNPGAYETHLNTCMKELITRPMTYGFKNDGRRRDPQPGEPKGKELMPGAYSFEDFVQRTHGLRLTYGFKGPHREDLLKKSMLAYHDKNIDVAPGLYETQTYQSIDGATEPVSHSYFKSRTKRKVFTPKAGPAPGDYEPRVDVSCRQITSAFRSGTDRFLKKPANVPGPGSYDKICFLPSFKQLNVLSTRGVFYEGNFTRATSAGV